MIRTGARPGVGEYLLAYIASVAVFPVPAVIYAAVIAPPGWGAVPAVWVVLTIYAAFCSIPFAAVGIPLVHVLSRPAETQMGQIVLTGAVTIAVLAVPLGFSDLGLIGGLGVGAYTAVATMTGRAVVIPLVHRTVRAEFHARERVHP